VDGCSLDTKTQDASRRTAAGPSTLDRIEMRVWTSVVASQVHIYLHLFKVQKSIRRIFQQNRVHHEPKSQIFRLLSHVLATFSEMIGFLLFSLSLSVCVCVYVCVCVCVLSIQMKGTTLITCHQLFPGS